MYLLGAHSIKLLQDLLPNSSVYFNFISQAADPAKTFSVIFPVSCVVSLSLGANILAASAIAEFTNILLKWFLMEHRPYWWVNLAPGRPLLRQTNLTCETGPGSPSGHLTNATVVCYIIAQWLCRSINEETLIRKGNKKRLNKFIWFLMWLVVINVTLSHMYHATHFPHQCFLGIFAGLLVSWTINKYSSLWSNASRLKCLFVSFLIAATGIATYLLLKVIGINPDWSIELASAWCFKPEYLHVNTTPLFTLVRDVGAVFGFALCSPLSKRIKRPYGRKFSALLSFVTYVCFRMSTEAIPTADAKIFYGSHFLLTVVQIYFALELIPYIANVCSSLAESKIK